MTWASDFDSPGVGRMCQPPQGTSICGTASQIKYAPVKSGVALSEDTCNFQPCVGYVHSLDPPPPGSFCTPPLPLTDFSTVTDCAHASSVCAFRAETLPSKASPGVLLRRAVNPPVQDRCRPDTAWRCRHTPWLPAAGLDGKNTHTGNFSGETKLGQGEHTHRGFLGGGGKLDGKYTHREVLRENKRWTGRKHTQGIS